MTAAGGPFACYVCGHRLLGLDRTHAVTENGIVLCLVCAHKPESHAVVFPDCPA